MAKIQEKANIAYSKRGVENFSKYDQPIEKFTTDNPSYEAFKGYKSEDFIA